MIARFAAVRERLGPRTLSQIASVPIALCTGGILAVARWLEPSAAGFGTHLQLGLRPCSVLVWTGYPCPMCGATTTFALMADFRLPEAIANQPFAALLFVLCLAVFGMSAAEVVQPRDRWLRLFGWIEPWEGWAAGGFLLAMAVGWVVKIAEMGAST